MSFTPLPLSKNRTYWIGVDTKIEDLRIYPQKPLLAMQAWPEDTFFRLELTLDEMGKPSVVSITKETDNGGSKQ
jgi:hypothetical protein